MFPFAGFPLVVVWMRSVVVALFGLPFTLVSHIPQVVSLLPRHKLRIMSGDLCRPPLAKEFIRMAGHRSRLLAVAVVAAAAVVVLVLLLVLVVVVRAVVLLLSPRSSLVPR